MPFSVGSVFRFENAPPDALERLNGFASANPQVLLPDVILGNKITSSAPTTILVVFSVEARDRLGIPIMSSSASESELQDLLTILMPFCVDEPPLSALLFQLSSIHCCSCIASLRDAALDLAKTNSSDSTCRSLAVSFKFFRRGSEIGDFAIWITPSSVPSFWAHQEAVAVAASRDKGIALCSRDSSIVAAAFTDGFVRCRSFTSITAVSVDFKAQRDDIIMLASDCGLPVSGHQWALQLNVENNKEGTNKMGSTSGVSVALEQLERATTKQGASLSTRQQGFVLSEAFSCKFQHPFLINSCSLVMNPSPSQTGVVGILQDRIALLDRTDLGRIEVSIVAMKASEVDDLLRFGPLDLELPCEEEISGDCCGAMRALTPTPAPATLSACGNPYCKCIACVCSNCTCSAPVTISLETASPAASASVDKPQAKNGAVKVGTSATFVVTGMSCASCAARIERELHNLPEVFCAIVNFATASATVTYNADAASKESIASRIEQLGYAATPNEAGGGFEQAKSAMERKHEIAILLILLISSGVLAIPLLVIMVAMQQSSSTNESLMMPVYNKMTRYMLIGLCLSTPVLFIGREFFIRAFAALRHLAFTMDSLIAFGVGGAYMFSLIVFIAAMADVDTTDTYFDAAAILIFFMEIGKYLEANAKRGTSDALVKLMSLAPSTATLITPAGDVEVPSASLSVGSLVRVAAGGSIPVDGVVAEGFGAVDEQLITGESVPCDKKKGDSVIGGTICVSSDLVVRATKVGEETTLFRITQIVRDAQGTKPAIQRVADRIAGIFVPIIISLSLIVFIVWIVIGYTNSYPEEWRGSQSPIFFAFSFFLSTIVVACPCALGLATPTAIMVGTGLAAVFGILIKGAPTLEAARRVSCVLFDKTGTLTTGIITVAHTAVIHPDSDSADSSSSAVALDLDESTLKQLVGTIESRSKHPIGKAITEAFGTLEPGTFKDLNVETLAGHGLRATVTLVTGGTSTNTAGYSTTLIMIGNPKHIRSTGAHISDEAETIMSGLVGQTLVLVVIGNSLRLIVGLSDQPKDESRAIVHELHRRKIKVMMVTGDNRSAANRIAQLIGIEPDCIFAEVLPEGKQKAVMSQQNAGHTVCFVGDGLNDSPALSQADVGVAIGGGTEVAIEAADAVLMHSCLVDLLTFFDLSAATVRRIYFNFWWALIYNVIALPFASGILYPAIRQQVPPIVAGGAMICSSLSVLLSSLLLKCFRPWQVDDLQGSADSSSTTPADGAGERHVDGSREVSTKGNEPIA